MIVSDTVVYGMDKLHDSLKISKVLSVTQSQWSVGDALIKGNNYPMFRLYPLHFTDTGIKAALPSFST